MTKQEVVNEISNSVAYLHAGTKHSLQDWFRIYDSAMDEWATYIAKTALLQHGISENSAHYTIEKLLKEN